MPDVVGFATSGPRLQCSKISGLDGPADALSLKQAGGAYRNLGIDLTISAAFYR